jgi:LacI family transcriptional regulator
VFVYGFSGPVFSEILEGINKIFHQYGFNIIVSSGKSSEIMLKEKQIDAAIIFDSTFDKKLMTQFAKSSPIVVLDSHVRGKNIYSSLIDNDLLVHQLIRQMINQGYQQFAYVSGPEEAFNNQERYKGYLHALQEAKLKSVHYCRGDFTIESGYRAGKEIANLKVRPDFIFCANDESALGVMNALLEHGIKIPEDIAVAGFDGSYVNNSYIKPSLTTIAINHFQWGKNAAEFLIKTLLKQEEKGIGKPIGEIIMKAST